MKNFFSRVLVAALVFVFAFTLLPTSAFAKTTTINNFSKSTQLSGEQFQALKYGTISAYEKSGIWYYKFKKGSTVVNVKVSAFTGSAGNSFSNVNTELSRGMNNGGVATGPDDLIYKYSSGKIKRDNVRVNSKMLKFERRNEYSIELAQFDIWAQRTNQNIILSCEVEGGSVKFTYTDKVHLMPKEAVAYTGSAFSNGVYVSPSTAEQYVRALKRTTSNGLTTNIAKEFNPNFKVSITKPGVTGLLLSNVSYSGKGKAETTKSIEKYVSVAYATVKLGKDIATKSKITSTLKSLDSLIKQGSALVKNGSAEYESRKVIELSRDTGKSKVFSYTSCFRSPIKLQNNNDYFQAEINLSKTPSSKTVIKVEFSDKKITK